MIKALITGSSGFAGKHLRALLSAEDTEVFGTTLHNDPGSFKVDLLNYSTVKDVLRKTTPNVIYHLAAFASPALSFKQPQEAVNNTLSMQINLFEACLELDLRPRMLIISSGQIYGRAEDLRDLPLSEIAALDFASPYAVAKVGQENLASMYGKRGFESVIARPFNHIGPGQQPGFLVADLAKQIAELEKSDDATTLKVGNLSSKRDFTDVRDIVRAYALLVEKGQPGEVYNVCSGRSISGQEILDRLLALSSKPIKTEPDPERMRPSDIPDLYGDPTKLHEATGWQPAISLDQTLQETLDYWRGQV